MSPKSSQLQTEKVRIQLLSADRPLPSLPYPCVHLIYAVRGGCRLRLRQEWVNLKEGELLLFQHEDCEIAFPDKSGYALGIFIGLLYFRQHTFNTIWRDAFFSEFILWIFDPTLRCFSFGLYEATPANSLDELLRSLYSECQNPQLCSENARDSYLLLIFIALAREYQKEHDQLIPSKHLDYNRLICYLNDNYPTVTLAQTAAFFHFSPAYISRFLKKSTGKTFIEYIQQQRMEAAGRVLRHTDMPVKSIAFQAGYQNLSYFYRTFEKYYGCTPMEYRERAKSGQTP